MIQKDRVCDKLHQGMMKLAHFVLVLTGKVAPRKMFLFEKAGKLCYNLILISIGLILIPDA